MRVAAVNGGPINRSLLFAIACFGIFTFGIVMAVLGAILPMLGRHLSLALGQMGELFLTMNLAMMLVMPVLGPLMDKAGMRGILMAGALGTSLALFLIGWSPSFTILLVSVFLLGTAGGCLNGAANTLVADLYPNPAQKNSALNLLGVFFGFGALSLPFFIGVLLNALPLSSILNLAALLTAALTIVCSLPTYPTPKKEGRIEWSKVRRMAGSPLLLLFGVLLFFESGNEFIIGGYLTTYLNSYMGIPLSRASYLLAAYWGTIMVARFLLSRLLLVIPGQTLILLSAPAVVISMAILLMAGSPTLVNIGIIGLGLSVAGIFPTALGMAGSRFSDSSGTAFGILFTIALAGGMSLPWFVGQISASHGLPLGFSLVITNALGIFLVQVVVSRSLRLRRRASMG